MAAPHICKYTIFTILHKDTYVIASVCTLQQIFRTRKVDGRQLCSISVKIAEPESIECPAVIHAFIAQTLGELFG